jgi:23S rRNA (uridine2552-2'-O)-methyltransferase
VEMFLLAKHFKGRKNAPQVDVEAGEASED